METSFGTTHVYRYGPADPTAESRMPVVLIHGAGGCSAQWYPNTHALSDERPVYALDTPGAPGRSVHRESMWQPEHAAQWMDEALDALGLDRVHLAGSSYGGWLVINQVHLRPGRIASVTGLDPGGLEKVGWFATDQVAPRTHHRTHHDRRGSPPVGAGYRCRAV